MAAPDLPRQDSSNHTNVSVVNPQDSSNHSNVTITVVNRQVNVTVNFNGSPITVTVTASGSVVEEWIKTTVSRGAKHLSRYCLLVGMSMDPGGNTLHLCVNSRCLIFQISQADFIPSNFHRFIMNHNCKFAGFWNRWQRAALDESKHRMILFKDPFDLRYLKGSFRENSTEDIVHEAVGWKVELKEEIKSSDWSGPILSDDQIVYACTESYCAFIVARDLDLCRYLF